MKRYKRHFLVAWPNPRRKPKPVKEKRKPKPIISQMTPIR
jgi:hypothetical protein